MILEKNVKPDRTDDTVPILELWSIWDLDFHVLLSADRNCVPDRYIDREFTSCWVLDALVFVADGVEVELGLCVPFSCFLRLITEAL